MDLKWLNQQLKQDSKRIYLDGTECIFTTQEDTLNQKTGMSFILIVIPEMLE